MTSKKLTVAILIAMIMGVLCGFSMNEFTEKETVQAFSKNISLLTDIFLRLIKMIIAPLVFATLTVGIARMGDGKTVGRVGGKTLGWFMFMSLVSLLIGLVMVNLLQPGVSLNLPLPDVNASSGINRGAMTLKDFLQHVFPSSIIDAMGKNEILQIVVFSLFFGVAAGALGPKAEHFVNDVDMIGHIMLKITTYIMNFAPVAVFAAISSIVAQKGLGILIQYGKFMGSFFISISVLWLAIIAISSIFLGFKKAFLLITKIREPILLAFSTASSEAAYPKTLEQLERFGCNPKIASFVLPIGYSFNLDGSMMYCTFASLFIAQAYGIDLSLTTQITMLLVLMITSKGIAGVPRASLVVITATLAQFNIPEAGLLLILGVDHFLDMARSATNVLGNAMATAVISKWEDKHLH